EGTGARADLAHDHEGRVPLAPALTEVWATGLLAHGDEVVLANDLLCFAIDGRARRLDPNPVRLAQHLVVGPVGRFGVPRPVWGRCGSVDECDQDWFLAADQAGDDDNDDRTDGGGDDLGNDRILDAEIDFERREQKAADEGADKT